MSGKKFPAVQRIYSGSVRYNFSWRSPLALQLELCGRCIRRSRRFGAGCLLSEAPALDSVPCMNSQLVGTPVLSTLKHPNGKDSVTQASDQLYFRRSGGRFSASLNWFAKDGARDNSRASLDGLCGLLADG